MSQDNRSKVAQKMLSGLPDRIYDKFVEDHLTAPDAQNPLRDPFQVNVPHKLQSPLYVTEEKAEKIISIPGSKIIRGAVGSGKRTLIRMHHERPSMRELIVTKEPRAALRPDHLQAGEVSLLTPHILLRAIFNSYWEYLICAEKKRILHLPKLRQNREWMSTLRWFFQYKYTCPIRPHCIDDFEFKTWLQTDSSIELFTENDAFEDILRALVHFIVKQKKYDASNPPLTFESIILMLESCHQDSSKAQERLIEDADMLYDLRIANLDFVLFLPLGKGEEPLLNKKVTKMSCVSRGEVPIHKLPHWSRAQFQDLFFRRIAWNIPGRQGVSKIPPNILGEEVPPNCLTPTAKNKFTEIIINSLMENTPLPIHALRLARVFVAACAGCFGEDFQSPLTVKKLKDLADLYWSNIKGGDSYE